MYGTITLFGRPFQVRSINSLVFLPHGSTTALPSEVGELDKSNSLTSAQIKSDDLSHNPLNATPVGFNTLKVLTRALSLTTTKAFTIVFSSCGYLDVSVHRVPYSYPILFRYG